MKKIDEFFIYIFIILQPILDVIAYFTFSPNITIISFMLRTSLLIIFSIYSFYLIKDKKKLLMFILPLALISLLHVIGVFITHGLSLGDIKNTVSIMHTPVLALLFIFLLKENSNYKKQFVRGLITNLIIIFIVIILSIITNTYGTTYRDFGIIGWFSGSNTPSMILAVLCPLFLMYINKKPFHFIYLIACLIVIFLLVINGTRTCYYSLIALFILMVYLNVFSKKTNGKNIKILISLFVLFLAIALYPISVTNLKTLMNKNNFKENQEIINKIDSNEEINIELEKEILEVEEQEDAENTNVQSHKYSDQELKVYEKLKTSYLYVGLMKKRGVLPVIERIKNNVNSETLADNRLVKRINSDIIFDESNIYTKLFGIDYAPVERDGYDPENDLTALFYYLGYIGFAVYMCYIIYFVILVFKKFLKDKSIIINDEIVILCYSFMLAVAGGELTGAFLRKPSANIYLSIIMALIFAFCTCKKNEKTKKITFLNLHLGYGGVETSTINTANALIDNHNVEIVSLYNLKDNQENLLDKRVEITHLYNGEPNKKEFLDAIKNKKILSIFKEGLRALKILVLKKYLIINYILNTDSKILVSTRWEFSKLLSKYKTDDTIAIAQEHHHHNNDKKYIKVLSKKYKNIDYLFALTKGLAKDYKKFLRRNNYTKIVVVPNMIMETNNVSKLTEKSIISVGRLHPGKKIGELITIYSKLENVDKFYIIGDGSLYTELKKHISDLKLNKKIILLGYKNKKEIEKYFMKSSVFVMASVTEGLPMVLLEAMNSGIPCVAYETDSGVNDIIDNNKNGYVIKNRNQNDFVNKLNNLLKDDKKLVNFSKESIKKSREFLSPSIVKIWDKIINKNL